MERRTHPSPSWYPERLKEGALRIGPVVVARDRLLVDEQVAPLEPEAVGVEQNVGDAKIPFFPAKPGVGRRRHRQARPDSERHPRIAGIEQPRCEDVGVADPGPLVETRSHRQRRQRNRRAGNPTWTRRW